MLDLYKKVREEMLADSTITDLVSERVYLDFKPVGNTDVEYPQITMTKKGGPLDSVLLSTDIELILHIWTKGEGRVTNAEEIAKRIELHFKVVGYQDPCIYQIWKDGDADMFEDDTQTFHKVLIFNVVMEGYSE